MVNAGRAKVEYHALYDMNRATLEQRQAFQARFTAAFARW